VRHSSSTWTTSNLPSIAILVSAILAIGAIKSTRPELVDFRYWYSCGFLHGEEHDLCVQSVRKSRIQATAETIGFYTKEAVDLFLDSLINTEVKKEETSSPVLSTEDLDRFLGQVLWTMSCGFWVMFVCSGSYWAYSYFSRMQGLREASRVRPVEGEGNNLTSWKAWLLGFGLHTNCSGVMTLFAIVHLVWMGYATIVQFRFVESLLGGVLGWAYFYCNSNLLMDLEKAVGGSLGDGVKGSIMIVDTKSGNDGLKSWIKNTELGFAAWAMFLVACRVYLGGFSPWTLIDLFNVWLIGWATFRRTSTSWAFVVTIIGAAVGSETHLAIWCCAKLLLVLGQGGWFADDVRFKTLLFKGAVSIQERAD